MTEIFLKIVNMSISASWLVLAVLVLRFLLKKAPKWVNVLLWGIVAVRLLCPISIESALSLIPSAETISPDILMDPTPQITTGVPVLNSVINPVITDTFAPNPGDSANPLQIWIPVLAVLWAVGAGVMLLYTAVSYLSLGKRLSTAVILRENIFRCEGVDSPFVLGILKPRIYLPYSLDGQDLAYVIAHEQAHIRRKDHWWKPFGFLLLTIYWFNPVMWVAYILLCRDIELACDEKVIAELGNIQRADYTQALVACSVSRLRVAACPLAFGEVGVKVRVKSILNYRKPAFWVVLAALVLCGIVAVCFLTNPAASPEFSMSGDNLSDLDVDTIMDRIFKVEDVNNSNIYMNANNFSITVDSDFNWVDSQAICYFFWEENETRSAQIRIFPDEDKYFLTESAQWGEQSSIFLLQYYLEALKYLPQDAVRQMAPADRYLISHVEEGGRDDYDRVISYSSQGVCDPGGWYIHLRLLPLYDDGTGYHGMGEDALELFYGEAGRDEQKRTILRANVLEIHSSYFLVEPVEGSWELRSADKIEVRMQNMEPSPEPHVGDILCIEYDGQIMETYPARLGTVYRISVAPQTRTARVPTDTELRGSHAGALLVPIDGKIYRYELSQAAPKDITAGKLLDTFVEENRLDSHVSRVYALEEYPDYSAVLLISGTGSSWLCRYSPPRRCSDTALREAVASGYVVMEDSVATHGQEVWKEFYDRTRQGKPASITVAHHLTLDPNRCDNAYYAVFSQDYPSLGIYQLDYDGQKYTLTIQDGSEVTVRTYEYLMKYNAPGFYSVSSKEPEKFHHYVLTHDNTVTWEELIHGLVSSTYGAYIDHFSIYTEASQ